MFVERYGKLSAFSGQVIEKLNDCIKLIHQKRSGKQNQALDEMEIRKRMEYLTDGKYERKKNKYKKRTAHYWEKEKAEKAKIKKRNIEKEIINEHGKYMQLLKENEKPLEEMTVSELKAKLYNMGISKKINKKT